MRGSPSGAVVASPATAPHKRRGATVPLRNTSHGADLQDDNHKSAVVFVVCVSPCAGKQQAAINTQESTG